MNAKLLKYLNRRSIFVVVFMGDTNRNVKRLVSILLGVTNANVVPGSIWLLIKCVRIQMNVKLVNINVLTCVGIPMVVINVAATLGLY